MTSPQPEPGLDDTLLAIAGTVVDDRDRAGAELADWFGRTPNDRGLIRMQTAPVAVARLLAQVMQRVDGPPTDEALWIANLDQPDIPDAVQVITRATARHLNDESDVGDELVRAHLLAHGPHSGWDLTVAGLDLISKELAEQRRNRQ
jgi:hypothetical protein